MLRFVCVFCLVASTLLFFISCGSSDTDTVINGQGGNEQDTVKNTADELVQFKYDLTIGNIPIPFDILSKLTASGAAFKKEFLNAPASVSKYSQNNNKALNLGIYGGDLAYAICFEQYQEVGGYLKSTKKLADDLGIPIAFDQRALTNFEKYKNNKDSLESLVFSSYAAVDKTLKSNERIGLASLVVVGSWLEGLYTTIKTLGDVPRDDANKALYVKIWEQKGHLNKLLDLLAEFKSDAYFGEMITELQGIKSVYDNLEVKSEISQKEIQTVGKKTEELRNKIIAG